MSIFVYLKLAVKSEDVAEFERDMHSMDELSKRAPGFMWSDILKSTTAPNTWIVVSEWEARDNTRAWEHSAAHEEIMKKWDKRYAEKWTKKRYTVTSV